MLEASHLQWSVFDHWDNVQDVLRMESHILRLMSIGSVNSFLRLPVAINSLGLFQLFKHIFTSFKLESHLQAKFAQQDDTLAFIPPCVIQLVSVSLEYFRCDFFLNAADIEFGPCCRCRRVDKIVVFRRNWQGVGIHFESKQTVE